MSKYAFYFYCFVLFLTGCSQNSAPVISADTIIDIHKKLDTLTPDSTYQYLKQAQQFLNIHPDFPDSLRAENSYRLGLYYQKKGVIDSAIPYFQEATDLVKNKKIGARDIYYFDDAWTIYKSQDRFGDCIALANDLKSLLNEEDYQWLAWVYYFKENTYMHIPDYSEALKYNTLRLEIQERSQDPNMIVPTLISQARLKFYHLEDRLGAFSVLDDLIAMEDTLYYDFNRQIYSSYGVFQFYEGNFKASKEYYKKGIYYTKQTPISEGRKGLLAYAYSNLAEVSIKLKEYANGQGYLDSVRAIGFEHIDVKLQRSTLKYQARLSLLTDNDLSKVESFLDSIYDYQVDQYVKKYNDELVALTKANETEKELLAEKQLVEIKALRSETRFLVLGICTLLLLTTGLLFYRQRKFKFEKQGLQMQQRLLRSQMNPHFTSNTLSSIQNLVETDQKMAGSYLLKFSRQLRLTLENSMQNYVLLEKELEALREYLELQLLRFPDRFNYQLELVDLEEDDPLFIPPMLIQPFIENSIEHGFAKIDYPGLLSIRLKRQASFIQVTIDDNGGGFSTKKTGEKSSASIKLISAFLKKVTKNEVIIKNKRDPNTSDTGVFVKFLIPFKLSQND